ncbi:MAG: hypothetical protein GY730_10080 [bacterium]|nr:hypothetical protein [bacterium]
MKKELKIRNVFLVFITGIVILHSSELCPGTVKNKNSPPLPVSSINSPVDCACYIAGTLSDPLKKARIYIDIIAKYAALGNKKMLKQLAVEINGLELSDSRKIRMLSEAAVKLSENGQFQQSLQTVDMIDSAGGKNIVLEYMFYVVLKLNMLDWAEQIADKVANKLQRDAMLVKLSQHYAEKKKFKKAEFTANKIQGLQRDIASYTIINSLIASKQFDKAQKKIDVVIDDELREVMLAGVAEGLSLDGQLERAGRITRTLPEPLQFRVIGRVAEYYAKNRRFDRALSIAESMQSSDVRSETLSKIALVMCDDNNFSDAVNIALSIKDQEIRRDTYIKIARKQAAMGEMDYSLETMGMIEDEKIKEKLMPELAGIYGKGAHSHYSLLIIKQMKPEHVKTEAVHNYVISFAKHGKFERIKKIVAEIKDKEKHDKTVSLIIDNYMKTMELDNAVKSVRLIYDPLLKYRKVAAIVKVMGKEGRTDFAYDILKNAVETIKNMKSPYEQVEGYIAIIDSYIKLKEKDTVRKLLHDALRVAKSIKKKDALRDRALGRIIIKLAESGERVRALRLLTEFSDKSEQIKVLYEFPVSVKRRSDFSREKSILRELARRAERF